MKASRFSDARKAFVLTHGADGVPVADICRKAGISQATYFDWKKKYDGMLPPDMRRLSDSSRWRPASSKRAIGGRLWAPAHDLEKISIKSMAGGGDGGIRTLGTGFTSTTV